MSCNRSLLPLTFMATTFMGGSVSAGVLDTNNDNFFRSQCLTENTAITTGAYDIPLDGKGCNAGLQGTTCIMSLVQNKLVTAGGSVQQAKNCCDSCTCGCCCSCSIQNSCVSCADGCGGCFTIGSCSSCENRSCNSCINGSCCSYSSAFGSSCPSGSCSCFLCKAINDGKVANKITNIPFMVGHRRLEFESGLEM